MNLAEALSNFVVSQELDAAATIDSQGRVAQLVGDPSKPPFQDLASALLGPRGEPIDTFNRAKVAALLPQISSQGTCLALVDRLGPETAVVLFYRDEPLQSASQEENAKRLYHRAKALSTSLAQLLEHGRPAV